MEQNEELRIIENDNYDFFGTIEGNRTVKPKNVEKIRASIKEAGQKTRVECAYGTSDGGLTYQNFVIDGQTRVAACMLENLPIKIIYYTGLSMEEIRERMRICNTERNGWINSDFITDYAVTGNESYEAFASYRTDCPYIEIHFLNKIVNGEKDDANFTASFRKGKMIFNVTPEKDLLIRQINELTKIAKNIRKPAGESTTLAIFNKAFYYMLYIYNEDYEQVKQYVQKNALNINNTGTSCRPTMVAGYSIMFGCRVSTFEGR